jgi:hypothetical protein
MPAKIGRNDPCPCGSGKKYKKCHGDSNYVAPKERSAPVIRTLLERNIVLLYAIADIFGLKRGFRWKDLKRNISNESVARFYRVLAELYPPDTNILSLLPKSDKLRGFYVGDMDPQLASHNAARAGLYLDEMLVVVPFYNPHCKLAKLNPINNPELFKIDTYKLINFLYLLGPALNSGILSFVPNPAMFDDALQLDFLAAAYGRARGKVVSSQTIQSLCDEYSKELRKVIRAESAEVREQQLRQLYPRMTDQEISLTLPYFEQLGKEETSVVLEAEVERKLAEVAAQILAIRGGVTTDTSLHICQHAGAMPYTNSAWRWQELLTAAEDSDKSEWIPLTQTFKETPFSFLNNVDRGFIGEFHSMKRLESFRDYMRTLWQAADTKLNSLSGNTDENLVSNLQAELATEHEKAKGEWARISQETKKWISMVADPESTLEPVVDGKFNLALPSGGFSTFIGQERIAALSETGVKRVPMAAYIELT